MAKKLKITQVRSVIGSQEKKHRRVMEALGLRGNYRTIYKNDSPHIRGMLKKVMHLVTWKEVPENEIPALTRAPKGFTVLEPGDSASHEDSPEGGGRAAGVSEEGGGENGS